MPHPHEDPPAPRAIAAIRAAHPSTVKSGLTQSVQLQEESPIRPSPSHTIRWAPLLLGLLGTTIVSLSFHVVMLQVLRIPYPDPSGVSGWAVALNTALSILATAVLYHLAQPRLDRFSAPTQALILFALYAMTRETARRILITGFFTSAWEYNLLTGLPNVLFHLIVACLIVLVLRSLHGFWSRSIGALVVAAITLFALMPQISRAFAPFLQSIAYLNHAEVYTFPYTWKALVPAYITFLEPVAGAILIAALVWPSLSRTRAVRIAQFTLLILLLSGRLVPTLLFSFYLKSTLKSSLGAAILSESQFLLEFLALALCTALLWERCHRPAPIP